MPYVKQGVRDQLDPLIRELSSSIASEGDLNYAITQLCRLEYPETYAEYNALIGVLESVKLEFFRRSLSAYEDTKIEENGDVY